MASASTVSGAGSVERLNTGSWCRLHRDQQRDAGLRAGFDVRSAEVASFCKEVGGLPDLTAVPVALLHESAEFVIPQTPGAIMPCSPP
jgi:hypothetical protein